MTVLEGSVYPALSSHLLPHFPVRPLRPTARSSQAPPRRPLPQSPAAPQVTVRGGSVYPAPSYPPRGPRILLGGPGALPRPRRQAQPPHPPSRGFALSCGKSGKTCDSWSPSSPQLQHSENNERTESGHRSARSAAPPLLLPAPREPADAAAEAPASAATAPSALPMRRNPPSRFSGGQRLS